MRFSPIELVGVLEGETLIETDGNGDMLAVVTLVLSEPPPSEWVDLVAANTKPRIRAGHRPHSNPACLTIAIPRDAVAETLDAIAEAIPLANRDFAMAHRDLIDAQDALDEVVDEFVNGNDLEWL